MNKTAILKISGIIIIPFLVMLAVIFFLYPKINADKYDEIVSDFEQKQEEQFQSMASDFPLVRNNIPSQRTTSSPSVKEEGGTTTPDYLTSINSIMQQKIDSAVQKDSLYSKLIAETDKQITLLENNELRLHGVIDSLYAELDMLEMKVDSLQNMDTETEKIDPVEFAERTKSLLNLEDEELSPILRNMTNEQIVKLYYAGGTIQRQKILRALEAKKAAQIMTEIM